MKQQLIELGQVIGTAIGTTIIAGVTRLIEKRKIKHYYRAKIQRIKEGKEE